MSDSHLPPRDPGSFEEDDDFMAEWESGWNDVGRTDSAGTAEADAITWAQAADQGYVPADSDQPVAHDVPQYSPGPNEGVTTPGRHPEFGSIWAGENDSDTGDHVAAAWSGTAHTDDPRGFAGAWTGHEVAADQPSYTPEQEGFLDEALYGSAPAAGEGLSPAQGLVEDVPAANGAGGAPQDEPVGASPSVVETERGLVEVHTDRPDALREIDLDPEMPRIVDGTRHEHSGLSGAAAAGLAAAGLAAGGMAASVTGSAPPPTVGASAQGLTAEESEVFDESVVEQSVVEQSAVAEADVEPVAEHYPPVPAYSPGPQAEDVSPGRHQEFGAAWSGAPEESAHPGFAESWAAEPQDEARRREVAAAWVGDRADHLVAEHTEDAAVGGAGLAAAGIAGIGAVAAQGTDAATDSHLGDLVRDEIGDTTPDDPAVPDHPDQISSHIPDLDDKQLPPAAAAVGTLYDQGANPATTTATVEADAIDTDDHGLTGAAAAGLAASGLPTAAGAGLAAAGLAGIGAVAAQGTDATTDTELGDLVRDEIGDTTPDDPAVPDHPDQIPSHIPDLDDKQLPPAAAAVGTLYDQGADPATTTATVEADAIDTDDHGLTGAAATDDAAIVSETDETPAPQSDEHGRDFTSAAAFTAAGLPASAGLGATAFSALRIEDYAEVDGSGDEAANFAIASSALEAPEEATDSEPQVVESYPSNDEAQSVADEASWHEADHTPAPDADQTSEEDDAAFLGRVDDALDEAGVPHDVAHTDAAAGESRSSRLVEHASGELVEVDETRAPELQAIDVDPEMPRIVDATDPTHHVDADAAPDESTPADGSAPTDAAVPADHPDDVGTQDEAVIEETEQVDEPVEHEHLPWFERAKSRVEELFENR